MRSFDFLFGWLKPWRWLRGGVWVRTTAKSEIGQLPWVRDFAPKEEEYFAQLVSEGYFQREVYR